MDFIEQIVKSVSWRRRIRNEVRRELLAHFEDALEATPEENRTEAMRVLIQDFGQPAVLSKLILRGKQRCRPLWEKAAWNCMKGMVVLVVILSSIAWMEGLRVERTLQATVARLRETGSLRDVSQLKSIHPRETVFFNGLDEDCATALLFTFPNDTSRIDMVSEYFDELSAMDVKMEQEIRELIAANETQLAHLRHIAELPPTSMEQVLRITGTAYSPNNMRIPSGIVRYTRLMLLNAFLLHRAGDEEEAFAECVHAFSLARHLRDIPSLVCQVFAMHIEKALASVLEPVSMSPMLSDNALHQFACDWNPEQDREALAQAIELEAGRSRWLLHDSTLSTEMIFSYGQASWGTKILAHFYHTPFARVITGPQETKYYTYHRELAANARHPYFEIQESIANLKGYEQQKKSVMPVVVGIPVFSGLLQENAVSEAQMGLARTALALNQYKKATGHYPETLKALIPQYLAVLPVDPFSGKCLAYTLNNGEYLLHSVGVNEINDLSSTVHALNNSAEYFKGDDIIWGLSHPL